VEVGDGSASGGLGVMERSEDSGSFLCGEGDSVDSSGWSDTVGMSDMDQISAELANRGPQKSDLKLRYCQTFVSYYGLIMFLIMIIILFLIMEGNLSGKCLMPLIHEGENRCTNNWNTWKMSIIMEVVMVVMVVIASFSTTTTHAY